MEIIYNPVFLKHDTHMHPEGGKRLRSLGEMAVTPIVDGRPFLELVHTRAYIDRVKAACESGAPLDPDTMTSPGTWEAALKAVGATVMASERMDFALVRPPGHHAFPGRSSGFCIFNNIAIAVQKLVGEGQRVLIFDFDAHYGHGTADIFYDSNRVMYWSIHQHPTFPGTGFVDETGKGKGLGYTVNVPLPPGSGDDIFMDAVETFLPVARQFSPDVVALSAGFDAHQYDLLLDLRVSVNTFYKLGRLLGESFDHIFATLEGGYNVETLRKCLFNFLDGINGKKMRFSEKETTSGRSVFEEYIMREGLAINHLKEHWKF